MFRFEHMKPGGWRMDIKAQIVNLAIECGKIYNPDNEIIMC
jgi:hypothetical protein